MKALRALPFVSLFPPCARQVGFHWPQFCADAGPLNATAFGMLLTMSPMHDQCLHVMKWPDDFCESLARLQRIWPGGLDGTETSRYRRGNVAARASQTASDGETLGGALARKQRGGASSAAVSPAEHAAADAAAAWGAAWARHGSCSGLDPQAYFAAAMAGDAAVLDRDHRFLGARSSRSGVQQQCSAAAAYLRANFAKERT